MAQEEPQIPSSPIAERQTLMTPWPWLQFFERLLDWTLNAPSGSISILTADPADPVDDTAWAYRDGASPVESFEWHVRRNGVTVVVPWFTLP